MDVEYLLNQLRNERYVMAVRRLILEDAEPKDVAEEMGVTVDNLYNIKKRAVAALTQIVLNDGRAQYER
jgi:DNA-directed RNA polymerase specialized sigma24 family protein